MPGRRHVSHRRPSFRLHVVPQLWLTIVSPLVAVEAVEYYNLSMETAWLAFSWKGLAAIAVFSSLVATVSWMLATIRFQRILSPIVQGLTNCPRCGSAVETPQELEEATKEQALPKR